MVVEAIGRDSARSDFTAIGGHVAAPGVDITSTVGAPLLYGSYSGTSMAAPHITGLVSYLYSIEPNLPRPTMTSNPITRAAAPQR